MKIGLYDVDGHNFPNLPLMKISAWHKKNGDEVGFMLPCGKIMCREKTVKLSQKFIINECNYMFRGKIKWLLIDLEILV